MLLRKIPVPPPIAEVLQSLREVCDRLGIVPVNLTQVPIQTFQSKERLPSWTREHGIYLFELNGGVMYIGRALKATLGERLRKQCRAFGDVPWDNVIRNQPTVVVSLVLPQTEWYLAAAIEAYLADKHPTPIGKRIS